VRWAPGLGQIWGQLWRRRATGLPGRSPPSILPGARVRLRIPLASSHKVWIPAGASGIVVGWDTPARRVSIELDAPRTVVTVPWAWVEEASEPVAEAAPEAAPPSEVVDQ